MSKITGNRDGKNGRNESYRVDGRNITRNKLIKEIEEGKHPDKHVYQRNGEKYARDNPDGKKSDNVNK